MTKKNIKTLKYFEIVIRPKCAIRSRQWWKTKALRARRELLNYLPLKKKSLFKNSTHTLLITNNKEMRNFNKKYRNLNRATDVLSFHLNKKEQVTKKYLGDIVISLETAKKQAIKEKKTLDSELLMLLVHAYLHLLSYDHKHAKEAKMMFSLQNKILTKIIK